MARSSPSPSPGSCTVAVPPARPSASIHSLCFKGLGGGSLGRAGGHGEDSAVSVGKTLTPDWTEALGGVRWREQPGCRGLEGGANVTSAAAARSSRPLPLQARVSRTAWRSVSCAQLWNAFGRLTSCEGQHPGGSAAGRFPLEPGRPQPPRLSAQEGYLWSKPT